MKIQLHREMLQAERTMRVPRLVIFSSTMFATGLPSVERGIPDRSRLPQRSAIPAARGIQPETDTPNVWTGECASVLEIEHEGAVGVSGTRCVYAVL